MNVTSLPSLDTKVTLREAYLVMFEYLKSYWKSTGKPGEIGSLLGELSLWDTESGGKEPMDGAVFSRWLECVQVVLDAEGTKEGYRGADILIDGKPPKMKVQR